MRANKILGPSPGEPTGIHSAKAHGILCRASWRSSRCSTPSCTWKSPLAPIRSPLPTHVVLRSSSVEVVVLDANRRQAAEAGRSRQSRAGLPVVNRRLFRLERWQRKPEEPRQGVYEWLVQVAQLFKCPRRLPADHWTEGRPAAAPRQPGQVDGHRFHLFQYGAGFLERSAGRNVFQVAGPITGDRRKLRKQAAEFVSRFA